MTQKEHTLPAELAALAEQSQNNFTLWLADLAPVSRAVIGAVAEEDSGSEAIQETSIPENVDDVLDPSNIHLFGEVSEQYPAETAAVLERSRYSGLRLAYFAEGTNLKNPEAGLGIQEAKALLAWLVDIQPAVGVYVYQHFDLLKFPLDKQLEGVKNRLLPHSLAAGLVSYFLANEVNRALGRVVIDPFHVLMQNLIHESQRMVTHHLTLHDRLLPFVLLKGLGHTDFVQDHGTDHPRILDSRANKLTEEQLIQFLLWMGDAFTKASPSEADPFATHDGKPHFREALTGKEDVMASLGNYGTVLEETLWMAQSSGEYIELVLQAFQNHREMKKLSRQYTVDMEMLAKVPQMLEERGVSLQKALDAVEPFWADVLQKFFDNKTISKEEMYVELEQGLEKFLAAHPLYVPAASAQ